MSVIGTWMIQSSPDFDDSYLHLERPAFVTLRREGDRIAGEYQVGLPITPLVLGLILGPLL